MNIFKRLFGLGVKKISIRRKKAKELNTKNNEQIKENKLMNLNKKELEKRKSRKKDLDMNKKKKKNNGGCSDCSG